MLYLPAGYGYWETVYYPIGGAFRRPSEDKQVKEIIREFKNYRGCTCEVRFMDGTTGALNKSHLKETTANE